MDMKFIFLLGVFSSLQGSNVAAGIAPTPTSRTTFYTPSMNANHFTATCLNKTEAVITLDSFYTALTIGLCVPHHIAYNKATLDENCVNTGKFIIQPIISQQSWMVSRRIIPIKHAKYYTLHCYDDGAIGRFSAKLTWEALDVTNEGQGFTQTVTPYSVRMFALKQNGVPNFDHITPPPMTPLSLGDKIQLVFMHRTSSGHHKTIIPLQCSAKSGTVTARLWDINTCSLQQQILTRFRTVTGRYSYSVDGTWAELTAFQLRQAPSADMTIECTVRVCDFTATDGPCGSDKYQLDYCRLREIRSRREADDNIRGKDGPVHRLTTTFTVQDNNVLQDASAATSASPYILVIFLVSLLAILL